MSNNANIYTELLAICKFKECLLRTKHIVPIVKEIDKEPVWDGNLYVYKEKGNVNNKSLIDSIPIQVKGTCKNRISNKLSYPIRTDDLEKFESNGGCIYFVVVLNNSGKRFSVFYKLLLPFDILSIMQGKENQSTINVHMNKLDINNISQMLSLFKSFINDRKKQGGTAKQGLKLREQLYTGKTNKDLNIKEFNLSFSANAWDNIPTYIYAKDNNEVELPIDCVLFKEISTNLYTEIEIGSDVHFCNTQLIKSAKDEYLIIENSIYISKNHKTLKFKFSDKLEERIAALNIMKSLYSNNTINIKTNSTQPVVYTSSDETIATVDQSGNIKALKSGTVKITAAIKNKSVTCNVTVKGKPVETSSIRTPVADDNISTTVYITKTGDCYHSSGCGYLSRSKIAISKSTAINTGYRPCSRCHP